MTDASKRVVILGATSGIAEAAARIWAARGARFALVPALGAGLDVVLAETRGIVVTRRSTAVEPVVEAGVRARAALTRRLWLDLPPGASTCGPSSSSSSRAPRGPRPRPSS